MKPVPFRHPEGRPGFGPWPVAADGIPDPAAPALGTRLNGRVEVSGIGTLRNPVVQEE